ncbi:MAG TPA: hypothetical protein VE288_15635 [Rubrobacteraceae bacterium]|jgi:hypothetical protein|nr:hypothetical protein [Rubrobacteraceae bacterium]
MSCIMKLLAATFVLVVLAATTFSAVALAQSAIPGPGGLGNTQRSPMVLNLCIRFGGDIGQDAEGNINCAFTQSAFSRVPLATLAQEVNAAAQVAGGGSTTQGQNLCIRIGGIIEGNTACVVPPSVPLATLAQEVNAAAQAAGGGTLPTTGGASPMELVGTASALVFGTGLVVAGLSGKQIHCRWRHGKTL